MSRDPAVFDAIRQRGGAWATIRPRPGFRAWTDDYGTILPLLRF